MSEGYIVGASIPGLGVPVAFGWRLGWWEIDCWVNERVICSFLHSFLHSFLIIHNKLLTNVELRVVIKKYIR